MENWSSRRIRELAPEIALRGMAANKIGCARISMMVRSTSSKARPDTLVQDRTPGSPFSLATHGGSIHSGGEFNRSVQHQLQSIGRSFEGQGLSRALIEPQSN